MTIHEQFSVLYASVIGYRSHHASIADGVNFVITCWQSCDCCLITKIYFSAHYESFLFKFSKNTFVCSNVEMLKFTNDLVYTTFKFFIYWPWPVVNSFGKRNFQQIAGPCSAIRKFVNIIDRNTIYMSPNMPQRAIKIL
jgi:hypothetical protein